VKSEGAGGRHELSDADLLAAVDGDPDAFGVFFQRHVNAILSLVLRSVRNENVALELTTEVFTIALQRSSRARARKHASREWLIDITIDTLALSYRTHGVEAGARRKLGVPVGRYTEEDWAEVEERMRNATSGPLYDAANRGTNASIAKALGRRLRGSLR
jgi:DNA-directed RNA polymerase specialized sigma24 family protein